MTAGSNGDLLFTASANATVPARQTMLARFTIHGGQIAFAGNLYSATTTSSLRSGACSARTRTWSAVVIESVSPRWRPRLRISARCASLSGFSGGIPVTMLLVAALYLGQQVYDIVFVHDNVANFMHIVGGICGTGFGYFYALRPQKRRKASGAKPGLKFEKTSRHRSR